jgi:acyl-CoA synthetase (AMP-forming)/AMP-acid ligase II
MTAIVNSLLRAAQQQGSAPAHIGDGPGRSWAETAERTLALADGLLAAGLAPGSRVAILAANGVDYFELSYALLMAGIVMVPLNTRLAPAEIEEQLSDCAADALVADAAFLPLGAELQGRLPRLAGLIGCNGAAGSTSLDTLRAAGSPRDQPPRAPSDLAAILYTGGTTGRPKGVMLSHRALDHDLACILADIGWPRGVRYLHVSPMFHLADLGPCWATTALLGTHVWLPRFSVPDLIDHLERHACSATALVPSMIAMMLDALAREPRALPALRHIGYGASAIGRPLLERLRARFPDIALVQFYGQTEAGGSFTCLRAEEHVADSPALASAGRPHAGCRVRILAPDGREQPRGTVGEIVGTSGGLFDGYLNQPEATAAALRHGWLHTGDAGFMDADGRVHVTDRLKDMVVTGGENVASSEVEAVLMRHPGVMLAAVVARPDPLWGEAVHAVIQSGRDPVCEDELRAWCRERIAGYKCPKSFEFRDALPLSAIGKVRKDLLRAELRDAG